MAASKLVVAINPRENTKKKTTSRKDNKPTENFPTMDLSLSEGR
jgi:hypothetical protein